MPTVEPALTDPPLPTTPTPGRTGDIAFETQLLSEAVDMLGETYARTEVHQLHHASGTVMRIVQRELTSEVRLDDLDFGIGFSADVDPLDAFVLSELSTGRTAFTSERETRRHGPGQPYLVARPGVGYSAKIEDIGLSMVVIQPSLLDGLADSSEAGRPIRFLGHEPVSQRAAQQWSTAHAYVRAAVSADPQILSEPLLAGQLAQLLAAVTLSTFPTTARTEPTAAERRDAHSVALQRALDYIESHAHLDITVTDVARASSVSTRALQLAFRRRLDTTPVAHLKQVRLARAHNELKASDPATTTVARIAHRWGFANPGRFAVDHREAFGTTPHDVLKQSP